MLHLQSLGYGETTSSKMSMLFVEEGNHRVPHALDASGNNLAEQKSSFSVMMWWLWWEYQPPDFCLVLCPSLFLSMPWGTILVAGLKQFPTNSTEDQNTHGAGRWCPLKPSTDRIYSTTPWAVACGWWPLPSLVVHLCTVLNKVLALSL